MTTRGTGAALAALITGLSLIAVAPVAASAATADFPILAGDQNTDRILRFDPATWAWDDWSWQPTGDLGFSATEVKGFNGGNDFRIRDTTGGRQMVVADGEGLVAKVNYATGARIWATEEPAGDNLHSVELLPDGNVAVAASAGGYVRVYSTANQDVAATFPLEDAHAVLWDPGIRRLWVAGSPGLGTPGQKQVLMALEVTGPASAPGLREDTSRTREIGTVPDTVHDVSPDHTDPDKLWITTNNRVYAYHKSTDQLVSAGAGVDRKAVKSISVQPSGQIVQTQADRYRDDPVVCGPPPNGNAWCTATLDFFSPARSVTRTGAQFYKARVASPFYGVEDTPQRGRVFDTGGGTTVKVDNNAQISRIAATADTGDRLHVLTLIQGSGMWSKTRDENGVWDPTATRVDSSPRITDAAIVADSAGDLHAFTLIPDAGVWYRKRPFGGDWQGSVPVYQGPEVRSIAAVVHPTSRRLHLLMAGTFGVRERTAGANGVWSTGTPPRIDGNADLADVAAAAAPDGGLHLFTVTPWGTVYHRTGTDAAWNTTDAATRVPLGAETPATGQVRSLAAAGWPGRQLDLVTLRSGLGLWTQTWNGALWPAPVRADTAPGTIQLYAARPGDVLHLGRITEIS